MYLLLYVTQENLIEFHSICSIYYKFNYNTRLLELHRLIFSFKIIKVLFDYETSTNICIYVFTVIILTRCIKI